MDSNSVTITSQH